MDDSQENNPNINDLEVDGETKSEEQLSAADEVHEIRASLAAKTDEAKAWQEKYVRLAAEMENYKRVSQRDQRDSIRFGNESILRDLLPVIDNLERAIKASKEATGTDALIQGVELTLKQLLESLGRFGVKQLQCTGQPFDPTQHQAVAQVESPGHEVGHIVEEYQKGYLLHERVLRAAMVSVAAAPSPSGEA